MNLARLVKVVDFILILELRQCLLYWEIFVGHAAPLASRCKWWVGGWKYCTC